MQYNIQNFNPTPPIDVMGIGNAFLGARNLRIQQEQAQMVQAQADAAARAKAEADAADREYMSKLYKNALDNPTYETRQLLINEQIRRDPDRAKALIDGYKALDENTQKTVLRDSSRILAAYDTDPEIGNSLLEELAAAAENSGNQTDAKGYREMVSRAKSGPQGVQAVKDFYTRLLGSIDPEALKAVSEVGQENRARAAEPTVQRQRLLEAGKTEAETNKIMAETRKLEREAQEALIELEAKKAQGLYTPEDAAAAEDSLRKEFDGKQKVYNQVKNFYDVITSADVNSIGDIALISTYMKILDPNSVVREGEYATAANAGGVPGAVVAAYNKALGSGKLDPKTRDEIIAQSKKIYANAELQKKKDEEFYTKIAKNRGLRVDMILNNNIEQTPTTGMSSESNVTNAPPGVGKAVPSEKRSFLISRWPDEESIILTLTDEELERKYKNTLKDYVPSAPTAAKKETVIFNFGE